MNGYLHIILDKFKQEREREGEARKASVCVDKVGQLKQHYVSKLLKAVDRLREPDLFVVYINR